MSAFLVFLDSPSQLSPCTPYYLLSSLLVLLTPLSALSLYSLTPLLISPCTPYSPSQPPPYTKLLDSHSLLSSCSELPYSPFSSHSLTHPLSYLLVQLQTHPFSSLLVFLDKLEVDLLLSLRHLDLLQAVDLVGQRVG